jgi:hypothetical protein
MSVEALTWALKLRFKNPGAKFVLLVLANYADENAECYPSQYHLSECTGIAERTINTHISWLLTSQLIFIKERRRREGEFFSNVYCINLQAAEPAVDHTPNQRTVGNHTPNQRTDHTPNQPTAKSAYYTKESYSEDTKEEDTKDINVQCREVFDHWQRVFDQPSVFFSKDLKRKIKARLTGESLFTTEQLCRAIDGCKNSPHHMGKNDTGTVYNSIDLIFRADGDVHRFISYNNRKAPTRWQDVGKSEPGHDVIAPCDTCGGGGMIFPTPNSIVGARACDDCKKEIEDVSL